MIKAYTTPDGKLAIIWDGSLDKKIEALGSLGIVYTPIPEELEEAATIQEMRNEYLTAMGKLQTIIDEPDPTTVNLALAVRIVQGMRVLARIDRQILILLRRQYDET